MTTIGGLTPYELKTKFQTPLYIYDEDLIRANIHQFKTYFKHEKVHSQIVYASKAFLTLAMARLVHEEGLWLDCVSQGELYTALKADFPAAHIVLHGNNKTKEELAMALQFKIGTIVVDNQNEANELVKLVSNVHQPRVMLRVNPGIEAHTHEYIKTSTHDSKFGMSILDPKTLETIKLLHDAENIHFVGTHSHIGSQILEEQSFFDHAKTILEFYRFVKEQLHIELSEVNLGGGFGIRYVESDVRLNLSHTLSGLLETVYEYAKKLNLLIPKVFIEPGRSIVGEAGYTLYTINQVKTTINQKHYMFIDGSMNDHIRTALYQAVYDAVVVGKEHKQPSIQYTVAGKACESGDIIIKSIHLPEVEADDLLLVKSTGAYHYSMASHYNRLTIPPVVFVSKGQARLVVRRESFMDLLSHDVGI